jgi:hypothetical protein
MAGYVRNKHRAISDAWSEISAFLTMIFYNYHRHIQHRRKAEIIVK